MDRTLIVGAVLGSIVTTGGTLSAYHLSQNKPLAAHASMDPTEIAAPVAEAEPAPVISPPPPTFARVIAVTPVQKSVSIPRQQCHQETITHSEPVKDQHQVAGTVSGAIVGGILGHQVGDGRGKDLATVAGAAAGAFGGRKAQQELQKRRTWTTTEQRCETVMEKRVETKGYSVRYEINGRVATVHMDQDPGERIPLENGKLVI